MLTLLKNKKLIIGAVIVLVAILLVWLLIKVFGTTVKVTKFKLPSKGAGLPTGFNPNIVSDKLFTALDSSAGWYDDTKNIDAYRDYLDLDTDDMKVLVFNTFNEKYQKESPDNLSLRGWVNDEYYFTTAGDSRKEQMNTEFNRLGLS